MMATRSAISWREWPRSKGSFELMAKQGPLRLLVISSGAEYLVMGYLMRRNILAYKAPEHFETIAHRLGVVRPGKVRPNRLVFGDEDLTSF